jgi:ribosomal 30S subunit maturation factor RimM
VASSPCSAGTAPALLGNVVDVQFTGENVSGTPLLAVETRDGELLIPLAEDICRRIDVAARRIEVVLPEGLRELNQE